MKLHFDSKQEFQLEAVKAITDIFEGQSLSSGDFEFYFKLPYWFEIKTPIGQYRPDWAVVFKGEKKIYFVAETKSVGQELRGSEKLKIACGTAHFKNFEDVVYKRVSSVTDLNT